MNEVDKIFDKIINLSLPSNTWVQVAISAPKDIKILRESLLNDTKKLPDSSVNQ